jgi:adenosylhomocysteine nucleosidase
MTHPDGGPVFNIGVYNDGPGTTNVTGDVIGSVNHHAAEGAGTSTKQDASNEPGVAVGIIAILDDEMRAVVELLQRYRGYRSSTLPDGSQAHEAMTTADGGDLRVAAIQAFKQGHVSAIVALQRLRKYFRPRIVLLVGIAGGVRDDVSIGDVVIGDEVIYYDARRETDDGPRRRGQTHAMAPYVLHRLHDYFVRHGDSIPVGPGSTARVFRGPIGSGDAVITSTASEVIDWLHRFNEKVLAVETEAGGVGQAWYEDIDDDRTLEGWLTIRGISDKADLHDWHDRRYLASCRAALVMDRLLPLLGSTK